MDFAKFYDEQHDYAAFRTDPKKLDEYKIAIQWKVKNLAKLVPDSLKFENILEVGCALGILLNNLADKLLIQRRFGIDIAFENIQYASSLYPDCEFICGTVENIRRDWAVHFPVQKLDLVLLSDIVEHIPDDEKFLKEISQITNYVLLNLPLEKCYNSRNRKYGETDPSGHLRSYNLADAKQLVENAGFDIVFDFSENVHSDEVFFRNYRDNRRKRVSAKVLPLKIFWSFYYSFEEVVKKLSPALYRKKYGSNFFALLRIKN